MNQSKESRNFWIDEATDRAMEYEHPFIWQAMVDMVDTDLRGAKVLDVGCNMGGFLRLLIDAIGVAEGFGYDPAEICIKDAIARRGERPLTFAVGDSVPDEWGEFDVAFNHEVLYLLPDLGAHARDIHRALKAGGTYYVIIGTHSSNPMMARWHKALGCHLTLPPIYSLDEVAEAFTSNGFAMSVGRIPFTYIPAVAMDGYDDINSWLDYYYCHKVAFKFVRT